MESVESVAKLLSYRGNQILANLLAHAFVEFVEIGEGFGFNTDNFVVMTRAVIVAPISDYDRLTALSMDEKNRILEAFHEIWPYNEQEGDMLITEIGFRLNPESLAEGPHVVDSLLQQLARIRAIMVDVSTGGRRINEMNPEFKEAYSLLTAQLTAQGLQNPIPYSDLWDWYGKWSSGDLPNYRSRREYLRGLFEPIEQKLRATPLAPTLTVFPEPTGWPLVDRQMGEVRTQLESASTEEQFQAVGLLCRETLISLAQTVFNPALHPAIDENVDVSNTNAKRMLDRYLAVEVAGQSNALARKQAKGSLDLANALQHSRTATFRDAALCAEATASVINLIAIVSGVRDP